MNAPSPTLDPELALLRIRAVQGGPDDWMRLGQVLVAGEAPQEGFDLYRRAAEAGHVLGCIEYGRMLTFGVGCEVDAVAAATWFGRAEAKGHPVAGYYLALLAVGERAAPLDALINERVIAAVKAGFAPALRAAALHFGRRPDAAEQQLCLHLLNRATGLGDAVAGLLLAARLANGEGCIAQPDAAARLHEQLAAAGHAPLPALGERPATVEDAPGVALNTLALDATPRAAAPVVLADAPRIVQVDGVLSADECRLLMASAAPHLRRSQVFDPRSHAVAPLELRTSSDASFDPILEDLALRLAQRRIAEAAGTPLVNGEPLVVLRYQPGEQYRPHRDYLAPSALAERQPNAGNRARTACVFLNHVEAGGETDFPLAGVRVAPQAGRAVVFDNLHADGRPDEDSLHAGLPVEQGEKWLATLWLRERACRAY